jgi:hypothetical protein
MLRYVHHPEVWRYRAALTRVTAEHGADVQARPHELRMAALYERFARYAEERVTFERAQRLLPAPSRAGLIAARNGGDALRGLSDHDRSHVLAAHFENRAAPAAWGRPAIVIDAEFHDVTGTDCCATLRTKPCVTTYWTGDVARALPAFVEPESGGASPSAGYDC